jgi:FdhE protein
VSPAWRAGHCPVCGAWPTIAEARGLEGTRRFRCGRCGGDWDASWLACPYCGNREHTQLGALVPSHDTTTLRVETCTRCLGYVKTVTALRPCPPMEVALLDLETVALDIAALEHGYRRPEALAVDLRVRARRPSGRGQALLSWMR